MNNVVVPKDFSSAVKDIKLAILQARAKAAHFANAEALKLYFFVGGYISKKTRNAKWGTGAIDALSNQLQVELPGLRGFSPSSIKRMRQLYEVWNEALEIRPLPMGEMDENDLVSIRPLPMGEITSDQIGAFLSVGFTNHALIVEKTKTADERWYYVMCKEPLDCRTIATASPRRHDASINTETLQDSRPGHRGCSAHPNGEREKEC